MKFRDPCVIVGLCLLACVATAHAQPVLEAGPTAPLVPSSLRDASSSSPFALPTDAVESAFLLHWGPVEVKPHLSDKFVYSDGIQATPGHPANTYINSLSGGLLLDLGTHWTLDYTPTWMIYTNRAFQNSVDHALNLAGGNEFGDWLVQFSQTYSSTNTPRIETGRQTGEEASATNLNVSHRFSDHWSLELGATQSLQFIDASPDNYGWSTEDRLVYRHGERLEFSLGYQLGFVDFDPGAYMTSAQPLAQVKWRVADKLTLSIQGGREHHQIHKTGVAGQSTPTWNASAQYQPFEHTKLTLTATRDVSPSYLTNSVTENNGWSADVEQRLLGHLTLKAGLSRRKVHFSGTHTVFIPDFGQENVLDEEGNVIGTIRTVNFIPSTIIDLRNDSTDTFHVRLSTPVTKRGTFTVLYERTRSISDVAGFSFTSHQIGCEFGYHW